MLNSALFLRTAFSSGRYCCFGINGIARNVNVMSGRTLSASRSVLNEVQSPTPPKNKETASDIPAPETAAPLTSRGKLKAAIRDYGSAVLVFHIASGVTFLGMWYLIVSSGVDVNSFLQKVGLDFSSSKFAQGAGTFAVAYALHKATAPVRIGITLTVAPLIVNYLRRKGIMSMKR